MKQYLEQANEWLAQLEPRERMIVLAGAVLVGLTVLYLALWEPLANAHREREMRLAEARSIATRLEQANAALARSRQSGGGANRAVSLPVAVEQSGNSPTLGKKPSRIQPEGDRSVNVWIEDVAFDHLVRWLAELETRFGIVPLTADIERQSGAGLVSARLSLARP